MKKPIIFKSIKNKYTTPWGHEFGTKAELEAFRLGMMQVIGSNQVRNEYMIEKLDFTKHEVENDQ